MRERSFVISLRSAALCLIAVSIFGAMGCGRSGGSASTASADAAPRAAVVKVRRAPLSNTLSIAGEFLPYQEVELHAKVAGYIRNINVDIGDRVRTGQVLAVLEIPGTFRTTAGREMRACGTARKKSRTLRMK